MDLQTFKPHSEKQENAIFSDAKITAVITGIQWGKSTVGALWLKRYMHQYYGPKDNFLVVAPTYKILAQATKPAFLQFNDETIGTYNNKDEVFIMHSGARVWFRTGTDPDSVVGITNCRAVWGDEAGKFSYYFWDNVQGRASFLDAPIILTTSPYSLHWLYKDYIRKTPEYCNLFGAKSCENPYFSKAEWDRRKATMDPRRFNAMYGGEFGRMQGLVYDCFDPEIHVVSSPKMPEGTRYFAGVDWGYSHPFVIRVRAITPGGTHFSMGGTYKRLLTLEDKIQVAKMLHRSYGIKRFYADPSEPADIEAFCRAGLPTVGADNSIRHGIDLHYELIKSGQYKVVKEGSKYLLDEYDTYHYPEPKDLSSDQDDKEVHPVKQDDHAMDAERYVTVGTYKSPNLKKDKPLDKVKGTEAYKLKQLKKRNNYQQTENWS